MCLQFPVFCRNVAKKETLRNSTTWHHFDTCMHQQPRALPRQLLFESTLTGFSSRGGMPACFFFFSPHLFACFCFVLALFFFFRSWKGHVTTTFHVCAGCKETWEQGLEARIWQSAWFNGLGLFSLSFHHWHAISYLPQFASSIPSFGHLASVWFLPSKPRICLTGVSSKVPFLGLEKPSFYFWTVWLLFSSIFTYLTFCLLLLVFPYPQPQQAPVSLRKHPRCHTSQFSSPLQHFSHLLSSPSAPGQSVLITFTAFPLEFTSLLSQLSPCVGSRLDEWRCKPERCSPPPLASLVQRWTFLELVCGQSLSAYKKAQWGKGFRKVLFEKLYQVPAEQV